MTNILSFGGGVNSTAIIALARLGRMPMLDHIVFSDTGSEWPHTYKYLDYLENEGIHITYLTGGSYRTKHGEWETLMEYCQRKRILPSTQHRWCSMDWKARPVGMFLDSMPGAVQLIGIDSGEAHRAGRYHRAGSEFPLVDRGIDRNECKRIILESGLGVPEKSGCYFCPYMKRNEFVTLKRKHPDLFNEVVELEKNHNSGFTLIPGHTIEEYVGNPDAEPMLPFGTELDQKCECYFQ